MDTRLSSFNDLNLAPEILKAIKESGYTTPTPIQSESVPVLLAGGDVFASADTGTGKTAAFMLPALQKLTVASELPGKGPRVLVLTPTRELATQILNAAKKYGRYLPRIKTISILGGMPYEPQRRDLRHYVDILIATPGRLLDHTREEKVDYSRVEMLVLDEADRMLDMGFSEDVEHIASYLPKDRQTVLFSATLKRVAKLATKLTKNAKTIEIAQSENTNDNVTQHVIFADDETHKRKLLKEILTRDSLTQGIVFSATKAHTEVIADDLDQDGISSSAIHGDLRQRSREAIIRKLRANKVQILVATDVAARGIDIPGLSHVINYDIPRTAEDYTHRIGRTGRAGLSGMAITFVSRAERHKLRFIEKDLGHPIEVIEIPGLEAKPMSDRPRYGNDRGASRDRGGDRGGRGGSRSGGGQRSGGRGRSGGGGFGGGSRSGGGDRGRGGERGNFRSESPIAASGRDSRDSRDTRSARPDDRRSSQPRTESRDNRAPTSNNFGRDRNDRRPTNDRAPRADNQNFKKSDSAGSTGEKKSFGDKKSFGKKPFKGNLKPKSSFNKSKRNDSTSRARP